MEARKLKIEYFCKDKLLAIINVDYGTDKVTVQNFTDFFYYKPFGNLEPNLDTLEMFLEEHVISKSRVDLNDYLKSLGLDFYDAEQIARRTHGITTDNFFWLRFDDEPLTWEEVRDNYFIKIRSKEELYDID